jgi:hypothetical protein
MSSTDSPTYAPHLKHRNETPGASQWTISIEEEHTSFIWSWESGWCRDRKGWGLHLVEGAITSLGRIVNPTTFVYIAKFVGDTERLNWHGYPADGRKPQDIPIEPVRQLWIDRKLLTPAKIRKIARGESWKP